MHNLKDSDGKNETKNQPTYIEKMRKMLDTTYDLDNYDVGYVDMTFGFYLQVVLQFGHITIFAIAFPLSPLLVFINNILQIEVNKRQILDFSKRPNPRKSADIGKWFDILEIISILSIFSNVGILVFTSNNFVGLNLKWKLVLFMCLVYFYILLKMILSSFIPDTPEHIIEIQNRHKYVIKKIDRNVHLHDEENEHDFKIDLQNMSILHIDN